MSTMSAADWRRFWDERGMRELRLLLAECWDPLGAGTSRERETCAFRIASLLGSRASSAAIAEELARIRDELKLWEAPEEDTRAAERIAAWFEAVGAE
ncbi:MAG: hypothetical protein QOG06_2518 [Gaiellaceae bacterium]|jgi:hypothetical protein|nr:hypothetical protein [Gaiellaceae bacterium]